MEETFTERPEEKKPKRVKLTPAAVIQAEGEAALVEWREGDYLCRAYVPAAEIVDDKCPADVLSAGIPYGVPWARFIEIAVTPVQIEQALYRAGFWTLEDLEHRTNKAQVVIAGAIGITAAHLHGAARTEEVQE